MHKARTRKRPCKICRKWFLPDARQVGRQKTCGNPACQKENHRRQCARWNQKNREYYKDNYLSEKLDQVEALLAADALHKTVAMPGSRIKLDLPKKLVADIIGVQLLVILEYIIEQAIRHGKKGSCVRGP
jgi:hypothetical protein